MTFIDLTFTRRRLTAQFAALATAAAVNPFPPVRTAAAQGTPLPDAAPAGSQVLRYSNRVPQTRLSVVGYGALLQEFMQAIYLSPFLPNRDGSIAPGVCLDYAVSDDQLLYTLAVDPAARFSDGSPVTAADIKTTWEWTASPASGNPFSYYQTAAIRGHEAVVEGRAAEMTGLVALDEQTLQVTLTAPFTPFIQYLSHCLLAVHSQADIARGEGWDLQPNLACGPFVVESFDVDTGDVVAVRNPTWWREPPTLERIEYRAAPDGNSVALLWENDEIDLWRFEVGLGAELVNGPYADQILETPSVANYVLTLDVTKEPTDDPDVRRALLLASDIETIVPAVFQGALDPATGINHPRTPGAVVRPPFFDPEAARAVLAASRYGGPEGMPPITIAVAPNSPLRRLVEAIQQGWQEVLGIDPAILPADPGFDPEEIGAQVRQTGNVSLFLGPGCLLTWGWRADNNTFRVNIGTADAEVEALLATGDSLPLEQAEERAEAYAAAEDLILERAYAIPLCWFVSRFLFKPWLANVSFNPSANLNVLATYVTER